MQTRKEKFIVFVKSILDAVHDGWVSFEFRHLWIARLIVYILCLVVVVSVCILLFSYFNLFHTDVNSARYMLSALVQSQAAIVAIVITLTLIAVQKESRYVDTFGLLRCINILWIYFIEIGGGCRR
jgi:type IV secretory pathway VirB6-like protein